MIKKEIISILNKDMDLKNENILVITSGYFDPLHIGHIECFKMAKSIESNSNIIHVVIINNNSQSKVKKMKTLNKPIVLMPVEQRSVIIGELRCVDDTFISIDDDTTVCKSLEYVYSKYKDRCTKFIFAKGGDRFSYEIPEAIVCKKLGITIRDGLGLKIQSSSEMIGKHL